MGVINVTRTGDHTARMEVRLTVEGAPDMDSMNSKRTFLPLVLRLEFDYNHDATRGPFWELNTWTVSGPLRLKDGRVSQTITGSRYGWGWSREDVRPAWVADACDQFQPDGYVSVYGGTMTVQDH